jgi:hypothetical protein
MSSGMPGKQVLEKVFFHVQPVWWRGCGMGIKKSAVMLAKQGGGHYFCLGFS